MKRRSFFKTAAMAGLAAPMTVQKSAGYIVTHNWEKYDFGSGPAVKDRLNQGPFPQYPPEALFTGGGVRMATTPSEEVVPNYGRGLIAYIGADMGTAEIIGADKPKEIEELFKLPIAQKIYVRPTWREVQQVRGRLNPPDWWKLSFDLAKKYNKQIGFRLQMRAPDYKEEALPQFVLDKVPMVKLENGKWRNRDFFDPRYDHPVFQEAYKEMNQLLAAEYNGHPSVEFIDTFMYGFWGEGHNWPFRGNVFPDNATAERTWMNMLDIQMEAWSKTPIVTNTQPDFSVVGNSEMLDKTVRSGNWIRTDTIFIENTQIDSLSNRPPWTAAVVECGMSDGSPNSLNVVEGVANTDQILQHVIDVGANYFSLWNFHKISAAGIMNYYRQFPKMLDQLNRRAGYNVRPSFVWAYRGKDPAVIIGLANDGISGVPGVLRISVLSDDGKVNVGGGVDPGYPLPGKIRQARIPLPEGTNWEGLKLKAEIEVKGVLHPVRWACKQATNPDGTLTLRSNLGRG
jgi:hypothetical protein